MPSLGQVSDRALPWLLSQNSVPNYSSFLILHSILTPDLVRIVYLGDNGAILGNVVACCRD